MKTLRTILGVLLVTGWMINPCAGQATGDSLLARKAYRTLKAANVVNIISIGFGLASNIEMAAIGGFPLEVDDGMNPSLNLSHMALAVPRVAISIAPPIGVSKARRMLEPLRESPELAASYRKLFTCLDAAQILTAIAPVLSLSGGILMLTASIKNNTEEYKYDSYSGRMLPVQSYDWLKTTGWVLVGTGLAASLSSAVLINVTKRELRSKMGTLKFSAGSDHAGVQYQFPVKH